MPPPISSTLLKSIVFPPSRPHQPPSPLIYGNKQNLIVAHARRVFDKPRTTKNIFLTKLLHGRGKGWWITPRSAPQPLVAARRWASGGPGHGWSGRDKAGGDSVGTHLRATVQEKVRSHEENQQLDQDQEKPLEGLLTLPTILTLARVAAVPLIVTTFYLNGSLATTAMTGIFVAAAITDWLDGYIARKMRLRTTFGAFLDPVADKLMVATTLVLLCSRPLEVAFFGEVPWLLIVPSIVIIGREITMSAVREWAASQDSRVLEAVAVSNMGKWKTATQMVALTILLATRDSSLTGSSGVLVPTGVALLYVSAGLALWSLVVYMRKIWRLLLK